MGGMVRWPGRTDAELYASRIDAGDKVAHAFTRKHGWVQVARGSAVVNGESLEQGDGVALTGEADVTIEAGKDGGEVLFFELA